jgi:hypothetical protein
VKFSGCILTKAARSHWKRAAVRVLTEGNEENEAEGPRLFFSFVPFVSFCEVLGLYFNECRQISLETSSRKSFTEDNEGNEAEVTWLFSPLFPLFASVSVLK